MTEHINKRIQTWNERIDGRMKELHLSQRKFAELYKNKYGTGTQADVSRWKNIGNKDEKTGKQRGFPAYETMLNIAELLDVSVGYLTGETTFETFDIEKASKYLGLTSSSVKAIRGITITGESIPPFHRYVDTKIIGALEALLTNPSLVSYLEELCELARTIEMSKAPYQCLERARKIIPDKYRDDANALFEDPHRAVDEKGVEPTEVLWAFANFLEEAALEGNYNSDNADLNIKASRLALQETHYKLIDQILSDDHIDNLVKNRDYPLDLT